jgi:GcrA cell cycle regulator
LSWTDERIDTLKKMWDSGLTATQIAEELGGVSRNAVIGKAHRLGLPRVPRRSSPTKPRLRKRPRPPRPGCRPRPRRRPNQLPVALPPQPRRLPQRLPLRFPLRADAPATRRRPCPRPVLRSVGPGGFLRQNPGEQSAPITPAPPRRLVPAKPSDAIAGKTSLLDLNDRICKWPLGHPGEPDFHFCGDKVNPGFPYCVAHCGHAYQAQLPRRDRRPPPPLPFGGPRVR